MTAKAAKIVAGIILFLIAIVVWQWSKMSKLKMEVEDANNSLGKPSMFAQNTTIKSPYLGLAKVKESKTQEARKKQPKPDKKDIKPPDIDTEKDSNSS